MPPTICQRQRIGLAVYPAQGVEAQWRLTPLAAVFQTVFGLWVPQEIICVVGCFPVWREDCGGRGPVESLPMTARVVFPLLNACR